MIPKSLGLNPEKQNGEELEDKSTFGGFFQRGEVVPWSEVCAVGLVVWNLPHKGRSYDFDSSPNLQLWISFLQDLSIVHPGLCGSCGSGERWRYTQWAAANAHQMGPEWSKGARVPGYPTWPCMCIRNSFWVKTPVVHDTLCMFFQMVCHRDHICRHCSCSWWRMLMLVHL